MNSYRLQHVLPASLVLLLAVVVTYLSFTEEPAESFLFPRVVSIFFIGLAIWNFIRAAGGMAKVGRGLARSEITNLLPGLVIMLIYVFWAAKGLGFYVGSTLAFLLAYSAYDPVPLSSVNGWGKRIVVTGLFMAIIYTLFALVLQVQTPRGLFL